MAAGDEETPFDRLAKSFANDQNLALEKFVFANMRPGTTVDFVVDLNFCPNSDKNDVDAANSPLNPLFLGALKNPIDVSATYWQSVSIFIDLVTISLKPSQTYLILVDNGQKFYVRGRAINQTTPLEDTVTLADPATGARALWPHMTGYDGEVWHQNKRNIFNNNLGRMARMALEARDNGLPLVLKDSRRETPTFTIIITDGSAKTPAYLLSNDPTRTMIIDIGGRRYAQKLPFEQTARYAAVLTLDSPQSLPLMANTARFLAASAVTVF